ncbi:PREDICTED: alpha-2-macroglobulin receptor-associated protein [Cyprinodon variegatus]|uniref:Low density lipoprotein receptor-related protein associated protein 1 n=1 Tax=Cyprinodon variegatus TaxID=28743 RepID=A0A3Q2E5P7_CYPVA|nr:PREDICTED: alpha-2-macroglobulin receptor-associated protein [Cyprinodon variegatus]
MTLRLRELPTFSVIVLFLQFQLAFYSCNSFVKMRLLCVVTAVCLGVGVMAGKYSREVNEPSQSGSDGQTVEFRIAKLNQVWEKAKRMQLSPVRQAELHSDLKIQEKDELQWKKMKVEGLDENGEKEAQLRRNFNVILAKYGMDGKRDMRPMESNSLKDHEAKDGDAFDDPKLDKLWNKAKTSGKFSNDELQSLKREFQHHKDKIHEYNLLMDTVSRTEEIHKNVISSIEGDAKEHVLQQKHTELKEKMRDLNHGFERLRKISHEGFSQDSEFREPRVIELWEAAKRANLSKDELESLKEELRHFETKVEKHSHYQEQLQLSHQKLQHVESLGDKEHIKRNQEKYNTLAEKTREMGYKMKKHLQDLSNKISRQGLQHNEL